METMLLYAGLPFVFAAVVCAFLGTFLKRRAKKKPSVKEDGKLRQWARRNRLSLCFGGLFLFSMLAAAVIMVICVKLAVSVKVYYAVCGTIIGAAAGTALVFISSKVENRP